MNELNLKALAKINLGLDVLARRPDGYHEVRMVMQTIQLHDRIRMRRLRRQAIEVSTNLYYLPCNENNLVYKAAKLLMDEFQLPGGVAIELKKHIPVAAGMAGGSSDAAAVLFGMNLMFRLRLSRQQLMKRGVKIGADVPYCILRGTALAEGIGEELTVLPPAPKCPVLVAKPPISVSTKLVYENLRLEDTIHPDIDGILDAIRARDAEQMARRMGNVLETVTIPRYPVIRELKEVMMEHGAMNAMMSGSGPTVFGLFRDRKGAESAMTKLRTRDLARQIYLTELYNNRESVQSKGGNHD